MDNAILIALIGGGAAFMGVLITTALGFLTWSRNIRFQILKDERDRLEKKFDSALTMMEEGLKEGTINGRFVAMCAHEFPENVRKEFVRLFQEEKVFAHEDVFRRKQAYFSMAREMSIAVKDYNTKIQETAEGVNSDFAKKLAMDIIRSDILKW